MFVVRYLIKHRDQFTFAITIVRENDKILLPKPPESEKAVKKALRRATNTTARENRVSVWTDMSIFQRQI